MIEGWHLLDEAIAAEVRLRALIFDESKSLAPSDEAILARARDRADSVFAASESQLKALSETRSHCGAIAIVDRVSDDWDSTRDHLSELDRAFVVVLDGVSDPGNCGSIVRGCDWFGGDAVILGTGCPERENGKLVRATMGGLFHLPVVPVQSLNRCLDILEESGFQVVASSLGGSDTLVGFRWPAKTALVIGNEARGISKAILARAQARLEIPKYGKGESLNAAMAASILLSHWRMSE